MNIYPRYKLNGHQNIISNHKPQMTQFCIYVFHFTDLSDFEEWR